MDSNFLVKKKQLEIMTQINGHCWHPFLIKNFVIFILLLFFLSYVLWRCFDTILLEIEKDDLKIK